MAVSLNGVFCFPWPDTGQIQNYEYHEAECAADGKASIAMSVEKLQEFIAASSGAPVEPPSSSSFTAQEIAALKYQAANPSPFNLSTQDGAILFGLILVVWVSAWAMRQLYSVVRDGSSSDD